MTIYLMSASMFERNFKWDNRIRALSKAWVLPVKGKISRSMINTVTLLVGKSLRCYQFKYFSFNPKKLQWKLRTARRYHSQ